MSDKLDFSVFHPLDHPWWDVWTCHTLYGGTKRHIYLEWEYRTGQRLRSLVYRQLHCRWGFHQMSPFWYQLFSDKPSVPAGFYCHHCEYMEKVGKN